MPLSLLSMGHGTATDGRVVPATGEQGTVSRAYAAATLCWLLSSGVYIAAKWASADMPPWTLSFWRPAISFVIMAPLVIGQIAPMWALLRSRPLALVVIGALGLSISQGFIYTGLHHTTAVNAGLIMALAPILTLLAAHVVLKEPLGPWQIAGSLIAFGGMAMIITHGNLAALLHLEIGVGELWMVAAAVCFTGYSVLLRWAKFDLALLPLLVLLLGGGALAVGPLYGWELATGQYAHLNLSGLLALAYIAIPGGAGMYYLYNFSVGALGAAKAGVFLYLQIFFVAVLAWVFLGEHLEAYHYEGGGLIVVGIILVTALAGSAKAKPA
jgi:drug/metabolite transporter (DMT)-like permease